MKKKIGKRICTIVCVALACLLWVGGIQAQDYPKSQIQIIIPFGPGGLTDILWRSVSEFLASNINGTITLVNKPGAGGVVGTAFVMNAKPDGYTIVAANNDPLTVSPHFSANVPYSPDKDFTYLFKAAAFAQTLSVRSDSPFKTVEELVAFAKANPKKLKGGTMGIGSVPATILGVFKHEAKIDITNVPFDGGGEVLTSVLGGHTDLVINSLSGLKAQIDAGKLRVLALCAPRRLAAYPNVPTLAEKGFAKASIATSVGLAGPKGLPPTIVQAWEKAAEKTFKDPKIIDMVEKLGGAMIDFKGSEGFKKDILAEYEVFKELLPTLKGGK